MAFRSPMCAVNASLHASCMRLESPHSVKRMHTVASASSLSSLPRSIISSASNAVQDDISM